MGEGPSGIGPRENRYDRCLGLPAGGAFETLLHDVEREATESGDMTRVVYHTPVGSVSGAFGLTADMKRGGASIPWIGEHLLKRPEDYAVLAHIFSNLEVVATPREHQRWHDRVGEEGVEDGAMAVVEFVQQENCECGAYPFPHRPGGGKCENGPQRRRGR